MANSLTVLDMVAKESLRLAHEKATFISTIDRSYDDQYKTKGWKTGSALRVAMPNAYTRRQGSRVMDVQDTTELTQTVTMATQDGVDLQFNSAELTLNTSSPSEVDAFSRRYLEPAMSVLISGIEADVLATATKDTYNQVGTAGTVVGSSSGDISALYNARAKLNQFLAPMDNQRSVQLDSRTMAAIANGNKSIFHPDRQVSKAFAEGYYGRIGGFDMYENERTYSHTVGSDVTVATSSSSGTTDGGTTITMNSTDGNINAGDVFTLPKVFAVHPETKASTGQLMQFVATAASTGAITVSPTIYWSGPRQNVCNATGGASVVADFDSETMTFTGTAATAYKQSLAYHRDFATFVTADLPLMDDSHKCVRKTMDGLSLRVWMASDIVNDRLLCRLDILYGFKTLRPEWACRLTN